MPLSLRKAADHLSRVRQLVKAAGATGETWGDVQKWAQKKLGDGGLLQDADTDLLYRLRLDGKAVAIELIVDEGAGTGEIVSMEPVDEPVEEDTGEPEGAMSDDDKPKPKPKPKPEDKDDYDDDDDKPKSIRIHSVKIQSRMGGNKATELSGGMMRRKSYDRKVSQGKPIMVPTLGWKNPIFESGEQAEAFGAWSRLQTATSKSGFVLDYPEKANDQAILKHYGIKTSTTTNLGQAAALVPEEFIAQLVDNLSNFYGVARQVCGVVPTKTNDVVLPKHTGDPSVTLQSKEGSTTTKSDATTTTIGPSLRTFIIASDVSVQLFADSAIPYGEYWGNVSNRAQGRAEDKEFFLGTNFNSGQSIEDKIGANVTVDAGASDLATVDIDDIMSMAAVLDPMALATPVIVTTPQAWMAVFNRFNLEAGGNTGLDITMGTGTQMTTQSGLRFGPMPVYLTDQLYEGNSDNNFVAYMGDFTRAAVFAERTDQASIMFSDQEKFSDYLIVGRRVTRAWWDIHDANNTSGSSFVSKLKI